MSGLDRISCVKAAAFESVSREATKKKGKRKTASKVDRPVWGGNNNNSVVRANHIRYKFRKDLETRIADRERR